MTLTFVIATPIFVNRYKQPLDRLYLSIVDCLLSNTQAQNTHTHTTCNTHTTHTHIYTHIHTHTHTHTHNMQHTQHTHSQHTHTHTNTHTHTHTHTHTTHTHTHTHTHTGWFYVHYITLHNSMWQTRWLQFSVVAMVANDLFVVIVSCLCFVHGYPIILQTHLTL